MLSGLPLIQTQPVNEARPNGRVFALWGLLLVAAGALAVTDANPIAAVLAGLLLPTAPAPLSASKRSFLALLAVATL